MSIGAIVNIAIPKDYLYSSSNRQSTVAKIASKNQSDSYVSLRSVSRDQVNELLTEQTDQNPNIVNYLRYQNYSPVTNAEISTKLYNEIRKPKAADNEKESCKKNEIVDDDEAAVEYKSTIGKGFFVVSPESENSSPIKFLKDTGSDPFMQKIRTTYRLEERKELGQLADLIC